METLKYLKYLQPLSWKLVCCISRQWHQCFSNSNHEKSEVWPLHLLASDEKSDEKMFLGILTNDGINVDSDLSLLFSTMSICSLANQYDVYHGIFNSVGWSDNGFISLASNLAPDTFLARFFLSRPNFWHVWLKWAENPGNCFQMGFCHIQSNLLLRWWYFWLTVVWIPILILVIMIPMTTKTMTRTAKRCCWWLIGATFSFHAGVQS